MFILKAPMTISLCIHPPQREFGDFQYFILVFKPFLFLKRSRHLASCAGENAEWNVCPISFPSWAEDQVVCPRKLYLEICPKIMNKCNGATNSPFLDSVLSSLHPLFSFHLELADPMEDLAIADHWQESLWVFESLYRTKKNTHWLIFYCDMHNYKSLLKFSFHCFVVAGGFLSQDFCV